MTIRPATEADLPGILEIYNHAVLHSTATADYEPKTLDDRAAWLALRQSRGLPVFVAVDAAGQIAGWSALSPYHDRPGYRFTAETSVYIAEPHRGQGLGKRLLAPLIDAARAQGLRALIASIDSENAASIRLHEGFGFERAGYFREVIFKFGRWLDVAYLELRLEQIGG